MCHIFLLTVTQDWLDLRNFRYLELINLFFWLSKHRRFLYKFRLGICCALGCVMRSENVPGLFCCSLVSFFILLLLFKIPEISFP